MDKKLEELKKSYDQAIDYGRKGIDLYENLPDFIVNDPNYQCYQKDAENDNSGSEDIKNYLVPKSDMKFVDLGCCLNLMFREYDKWLSSYYGVDISEKTIQLLNNFVSSENLTIGSLYCGSIHETPYEDEQFDIGTCIGVLEYFTKDFVQLAVEEMSRIMKPQGKFVLDIPDIGSPACSIAMKIEEYLGRPDLYDLSVLEFEEILSKNHFKINKKQTVGPMTQYFLSCSEG